MFSYEQIQKLNDLELSVYNYVSQNMEAVKTMKIRELADRAHVSTTTVLNFCNKMDCQGYSEFKVKLQLFMEKNQGEQLNDDTLAMMDFFQKINTPAYKRQIDYGAQLIHQAKHIYFYGVGNSNLLGQYGARYLSNMGIYATCDSDPFYPLPTRGNGADSLVIVLSVSGESSIVVGKTNEYKQNQFKILSITNSDSSTLAKVSDCAVSYFMPIEMKGPSNNITSQVPVVHIMESLARQAYELKINQKEE